MKTVGHDSLKTGRTLKVDGKTYHYFSIPEAEKTIGSVARLPVSLKVLLENVLRFEDGHSYTVEDAKAIAGWLKEGRSTKEVPSSPRASSCRISPAFPPLWIWPRCAMASSSSRVTRRR